MNEQMTGNHQKENIDISSDLNSHSGWRLTKIIIILIMVILGVGILTQYPKSASDCQWQHLQYINRNDPNIVRSFFAPPPPSEDCTDWDVIGDYVVYMVGYIILQIGIYFIVRRVAKYIVFGPKRG